VDKALSINIAVFVPAVLLGMLGGVLGAFFTFINLKITRCRNSYIKPHRALRVSRTARSITSSICQAFKQCLLYICACARCAFDRKVIEPMLIAVIITTLSVFLPMAFACVRTECPGARPGVMFCDGDCRGW